MNSFRSKFPYKSDRIYFDNSASTQKPLEVIKSICDFYAHNYGPVHRAIYLTGENSTVLYEDARDTVANFISCDSNEIVFTSGTTEGINFIANTWAYSNINSGDEIILTELEHNSNLAPWLRLSHQKNIIIKYIPVTLSGELDLSMYLEMLSPKTKLVSFSICSNSLGTTLIQEQIDYIINNARNFGSKILIDAAQAVGYKEVNINKLNADFLVFSAHKMFGPTGIGALYISKSLHDQIEPYQVGGGMVNSIDYNCVTWAKSPQKYEAGTPPIAQAIGFAEAIRFINQNIHFEDLNTYLSSLCRYFIDSVSKNPKIKIIGPIGNLKQYGHLVSFAVKGIHAHDVAAYLDTNYKIEVRAGNHCTNALFKKLNIDGSVRASFHAYNTIEEVDILIQALNELCKQV